MKRALILVLFLICLPAQAWAETKKISGTVDIEDSFIRLDALDWNLGSDDVFSVSNYSAGVKHRGLIRVKNVGNSLGTNVAITACVCSLYVWSGAYPCAADAYQVFKPWNEGQLPGGTCSDSGVTWNDWNCTAYEWTTAGCDCAGDGGFDNDCDDGACDDNCRDRKNTAESSTEVTGAGWWSWDISPALAQAWCDGKANENGIILIATSAGKYFYARSTEYSLTYGPFFTFTYEKVDMRIKDDWRFRTHFMRDWRFQNVGEWGITPKFANGEILKRLEDGKVAHVVGRQ